MYSHQDTHRQQRLEAIQDDLWASYDLHSQRRFPAAEYVLRRALKNLLGLTPGSDLDDPLITCLNNLVAVLSDQGRTQEAELFALQAVQTCEESLVDEARDNLASCLRNLAGVYQDQERLDEAEELFLRTLVLRRQAGDIEGEAATLRSLGDLSYDLGRLEQAAEYTRLGLHLVDRHSEMGAGLFGNLGIYLSELGPPDAATPYYRQCLQLDRELLGEEHPYVATDLSNLSVHLIQLGRPLEAVAPLEQAVAIRHKVLGAEHPDTVSGLRKQADLLHLLGRYRPAEQRVRELLPRLQRAWGERHSEVGRGWELLAKVLYELGQYPGAQVALEQARSIFLARGKLAKLRQIQHTETFLLCALQRPFEALLVAEALLQSVSRPLEMANALAAVSRVYGVLDRDTRSLDERRLSLLREALGPVHVDVKQAEFRCHGCAEADLRRILAVQEGCLGPRHPDLAPLWKGLAELCAGEEAEILLRRSLEVVGGARGAGHPDLAWTHRQLGQLLERQGRCPEAEVHLERAFQVARGSDPADPRALRSCWQTLADFQIHRGEPHRVPPFP